MNKKCCTQHSSIQLMYCYYCCCSCSVFSAVMNHFGTKQASAFVLRSAGRCCPRTLLVVSIDVIAKPPLGFRQEKACMFKARGGCSASFVHDGFLDLGRPSLAPRVARGKLCNFLAKPKEEKFPLLKLDNRLTG